VPPINIATFNSSEYYVVRSFQTMVWLVYPSNNNCTELFGILEAESAGTVTSARYHSLKSPVCSCVSITSSNYSWGQVKNAIIRG
jgi:hypothetical protein